MISPERAVNRSCSNCRLVHTDGAVGTVARMRHQRTRDETIDRETEWKSYTFPGKSGPADRTIDSSTARRYEMRRHRIAERIAATVLLVGLGAGCASSQSTTSEDETRATESSESTGQAESTGGDSGKTKAIERRVHFEEILGTQLQRGEKPTGCRGSWEPVDQQRFPGEVYFCSEFNGPEKWGKIPVTFAIEDRKLSLVAVQIYYDGIEDARDEYQAFSADLLDRCSRNTGFDKNIVVECEDYFVDVSWQGHHETGQMEVIYALNEEDLPN